MQRRDWADERRLRKGAFFKDLKMSIQISEKPPLATINKLLILLRNVKVRTGQTLLKH